LCFLRSSVESVFMGAHVWRGKLNRLRVLVKHYCLQKNYLIKKAYSEAD
jgi:hypothetical protein